MHNVHVCTYNVKSIVYVHTTYSISFAHLNLDLGEVARVGSDGGVCAASISQ